MGQGTGAQNTDLKLYRHHVRGYFTFSAKLPSRVSKANGVSKSCLSRAIDSRLMDKL